MKKITSNEVNWNITLKMNFEEWMAISSAVEDDIKLLEFFIKSGYSDSSREQKNRERIKMLQDILKELNKSNWKTLN